jgi:hypothetical protein
MPTWIKASKKSPPENKEVSCKVNNGGDIVHVGLTYKHGEIFYNRSTNYHYTIPLKKVEWLDESQPPSSLSEGEVETMAEDYAGIEGNPAIQLELKYAFIAGYKASLKTD